MTSRIVVIGVGNPYRRDDGVGLAVLARIRARELPGVQLVESDGEPTQLLDLWAGADLAVVVDAARVPVPQPGRIHRRSLLHPSLRGTGSASSHGVDLGDAVALAAALDRLPSTLLLYVVEVADTTYGEGLSPAVDTAASLLADEIVAAVLDRSLR
jgi:hydrogenase maturation protease